MHKPQNLALRRIATREPEHPIDRAAWPFIFGETAAVGEEVVNLLDIERHLPSRLKRFRKAMAIHLNEEGFTLTRLDTHNRRWIAIGVGGFVSGFLVGKLYSEVIGLTIIGLGLGLPLFEYVRSLISRMGRDAISDLREVNNYRLAYEPTRDDPTAALETFCRWIPLACACGSRLLWARRFSGIDFWKIAPVNGDRSH